MAIQEPQVMGQPRAVGKDASPLRVGIVGAGVIGTVHRAVYEQLPATEVAALVDLRGVEVLTQAGAAYVPGSGAVSSVNLPVYATLTEMLESEQIDIVDICTPTTSHRAHTIEALLAGKHVLCEKPMGRTSADCDAMLEAARNTDRRFMVAHCLRFWPMYEYLNEIVNSGEYGRVERARFARQVIVPEGGWFLNGELSGGAILDLHIHDVDSAAWIFGVPKSVTAFGRIGPSGCHDQVSATWHYDDDRLIVLEGMWQKTARLPFEMNFEVALEGATVTFNTANQAGLELHIPGRATLRPELGNRDGYFYEIDYFVSTILEDQPVTRATPESSCMSVALVEHEIESILSRKTVEVRAS